MDIIRLAKAHPGKWFGDVAEIHIAEVHHGCLPALGVKSLAMLYQELAAAPSSGLWVAVEGGQVVGFLSGCASTRRAYQAVLARIGVPLLLASVRSMAGHGLLRNLWAVMRYPFRAPKPAGGVCAAVPKEPGPELLAIAVRNEWQGHGIGSLLIQAFEAALPGWGCGGRYCVSTNAAEAGSNGFYRKQGFVPCGTMRYHRLTLQVYRKELPSDPAAGAVVSLFQ